MYDISSQNLERHLKNEKSNREKAEEEIESLRNEINAANKKVECLQSEQNK